MNAAIKPPWMGLRRPLKLDTESRFTQSTALVVFAVTPAGS